MWQIDANTRARIRELCSADPDRDVAMAMICALDLDLQLEDLSMLLGKSLDAAASVVRWKHPGTERAKSRPIPAEVTAYLVGLKSHPDEPLLTGIGTDDWNARFSALFARIAAQAGLAGAPDYVPDPHDLGAVCAGMTRDCTDPWTNFDVTTNGATRPCCKVSHQFEPPAQGAPVGGLMSGARRKAMQDGLLTGRLAPECNVCSIRKAVPVSALQSRIAALAAQNLSAPTTMRIELTTNCNLRCSYCAVTHPNYRGEDMPLDQFSAILATARTMPRDAEVSVNGHGETTFHPDWMRLCRPLVDMGFRPLITTNLAKPYSGDEIALLARFGVIQVSLDSSDATMTRQIRKAVTPDRILANVARIRAASQGLPPRFTISAGLYDPSIWTLPQFADWIISNGFAGVTFWSLVKLDHVSQVMPLVSIDGERLAQVRRILSDVRARLAAARVGSDFAGDFNGSDGLPLLAA